MPPSVAEQPSPLRRLTLSLKERMRGCASPRSLKGLGGETVRKGQGKATAPALSPRDGFAIAAVVVAPQSSPLSFDAPQLQARPGIKTQEQAANPPAQAAGCVESPRSPTSRAGEAVAVGPRLPAAAAAAGVPATLAPEAEAAQASTANLLSPRPAPSEPAEWLFSRPEDRPPSQNMKLPPVDHPAEKLQAALAMLSISTPTDPALALTTLRQLALNNPALLQPKLAEVVPLVLRYVRSSLPGLSHTAIVLMAELLAAFGDAMSPHCQDRRDPEQSVVLQLLLKATASGSKVFVVHGAQLALRTLATRMSPAAAAELLQPYAANSKQPAKMRALAAELLEATQAAPAKGQQSKGQ